MDRSARRSPDPVVAAPDGERRRWVRHRLHTPVYASFNGPQTGMVVDLSELLDLHEDGFAVQTSEPLEINRAVTLCLDLPETKSFVHGSGQVIWSDSAGRAGVRFSGLPESSRQVLKDWLLANLLIGCSNHAARTEQLARREQEKSPGPAAPNVIPISGRGEVLSSSELAAVRNEIRELGQDLDAILRLITDRALSFTGAGGAALAFLTDDRMICRARAGVMAPPLGAPVDVTQGLTGECVRNALLVWCEDLENDPRVDPAVGRALGIGSIMAAPIVSDLRVLGLLEVFSPDPRAFTVVHATVLERLVNMIPKARREKTAPEGSAPETPVGPEAMMGMSPPPEAVSIDLQPGEIRSTLGTREALDEKRRARSLEAPEQVSQQVPEEAAPKPDSEQVDEKASTTPSRLLYRALLGLVIAVVAMVVGYLAGPGIEKRWADSPQASRQVPAAGPVSAQNVASHSAAPKSLEDVRKLAEAGDGDAQWQMAVRYHNGEGVLQDDAQAVQWFQRAAEQGNVPAQRALGAYYFAGRGVPEDMSKAYMWSAIAVAGGDEDSKSRLEGIASGMSRAQVSDARQDAEKWIQAHTQRAKSEAN